MKQTQEMMTLQPKPLISQNSINIVKQKGDSQVPAYMDMNTYLENQRKKEDMKRLYDQDKLREVTGKPQISGKARSLHRKVDDLYTWQKDAQRKKEDL